MDVAKRVAALTATLRLLPVAESAAGRFRWLVPLLCPTPMLAGREGALYAAHCLELVTRAAAGADLRPPTDAEVLGALADLSLKAPPGGAALALTHRLFRGLFPDHPLAADPPREPYPGAAAEREHQLRRALAQPWRVR